MDVMVPSRRIHIMGASVPIRSPATYARAPVSETSNNDAPLTVKALTLWTTATGCPVTSRRLTSKGTANSVAPCA